MRTKPIKPWAPMTESQIQEAESALEVRFPKAYRQFLMEYGGCNLSDTYDDCDSNTLIPDLNIGISLDTMFGFTVPNTGSNALGCTEMFRDDVPETMVLIGDSLENGFIVLDCEDGQVYYYDHAYMLEGSSDEGNSYWLADSFEEFWEDVLHGDTQHKHPHANLGWG